MYVWIKFGLKIFKYFQFHKTFSLYNNIETLKILIIHKILSSVTYKHKIIKILFNGIHFL